VRLNSENKLLRKHPQDLLNGRSLGGLSDPAETQEHPDVIIQSSFQGLVVRRSRWLFSLRGPNHDLRGVLDVIVWLFVSEHLKVKLALEDVEFNNRQRTSSTVIPYA
jgi:hypothetical protein